jgi:hypothetical protein
MLKSNVMNTVNIINLISINYKKSKYVMPARNDGRVAPAGGQCHRDLTG